MSHAQPQTTIQPLISHVIRCGWYSTHKQFPCTLLGHSSISCLVSSFILPILYVRAYIRTCIHTYVCAMEKNTLIAIGFVSYSCQLQLQTLCRVAGASLPGPFARVMLTRHACKSSWWPSKGQCGESLVVIILMIYTHWDENLNALNYVFRGVMSCPYISRRAYTKDDDRALKRAHTSACYRRGVTHNSHFGLTTRKIMGTTWAHSRPSWR